MSALCDEDTAPIFSLIRSELFTIAKEEETAKAARAVIDLAEVVVLGGEDVNVVEEKGSYGGLFSKLRKVKKDVVVPAVLGSDDMILQRIDDEMKRFSDMPSIAFEERNDEGKIVFANPLLWWKKYCKDFPLLSQLARRILCIPATSAPSERVFSLAGLVITQLRASLSADNAAGMIFLHDNWKIAEIFHNKKNIEDGLNLEQLF